MHAENAYELDFEIKKCEIKFWQNVNHEFDNSEYFSYSECVEMAINSQLEKSIDDLKSKEIEKDDIFAMFLISKCISEVFFIDSKLLKKIGDAGFDFSSNKNFKNFIDDAINSILLETVAFYNQEICEATIDLLIKMGWNGWDENEDFEFYLKKFIEERGNERRMLDARCRVKIAGLLRTIHEKKIFSNQIAHSSSEKKHARCRL